jgi:hypothetical protein
VDPNTYGSCAYIPFNMTGPYRFAVPTCQTVGMVIQGRGATPHPIHMHVHPFQVISSTSNSYSTVWGNVGDYRDVMPGLAGTNTLRFASISWQGPIMIHCHFLLHEDMGMMDRWWSGTTSSTACVATSVSKMCDSVVPTSAFGTTFAAAPTTCGSSTSSTTTTPTTTTAGTTPTTPAPVGLAATTTTTPRQSNARLACFVMTIFAPIAVLLAAV